MCPDLMAWVSPWVSFREARRLAVAKLGGRRAPEPCGYGIGHFLYSSIRQPITNLTSARLIRSNRPHAQVAELVDALASGASGFTAVKVRVLSWAPRASFHVRTSYCAPGSLS